MTDTNSPATDNKPSGKPQTDGTDKIGNSSTTANIKAPKRTPTRTAATKKRSKTAVLAFVFSITALAGLGAGYYWQNIQLQALANELVQENHQQLIDSEQKIQDLLLQQQSAFKQQIELLLTEQSNSFENQLVTLDTAVDKLQQKEPSDWLVHEAEYLIRVASRTIWLEQDTLAAINLLIDADTRLKELNDPKYLPVRQVLRQDIETLKLLPQPTTEEVVLTLLALEQQVRDLPIAMAHIPNSAEPEENFELTDKTEDWQSNLQKTWQKFLADFITVKRRTANVEALLTPQQQQHLRQNLVLKIQLAIWAASQQNNALYTKTLADIQQWLNEYFDTDETKVQNFTQSVQLLKSEIISVNLPQQLEALTAIRTLIKAENQIEGLNDNNNHDIEPATKAKPEPADIESQLTPQSEQVPHKIPEAFPEKEKTLPATEDDNQDVLTSDNGALL